MKKYNLAKILRWRENDTDVETTRENGKERETKADKTFVNSDMQKNESVRGLRSWKEASITWVWVGGIYVSAGREL